jgi:hypothetical protein
MVGQAPLQSHSRKNKKNLISWPQPHNRTPTKATKAGITLLPHRSIYLNMEPVRVVASMMRELPASPFGRIMTLAAFSSQ